MDPKHSHSVRLNDGNFMPRLGFGTFAPAEVPKSKAFEFTKIAIEAGFRHIDAAFVYENEEEVGAAIREKIADGTVKREDIFYTTKLWATYFRPDLVRTALELSLKKLQMDYVDLFIIHFPVAMRPGDELLPMDDKGQFILDSVDLRDTWEALEKCKDAGLTRSIGVSNFNRKQLEMILNKSGLKYKPTCNQVECHAYLNQSKLLEYCKSKDIVLVAYSALGSHRDPNWVDPNSPRLLEDPVLNAIAKKQNRGAGQIALRYLLQRGVVVLAKSFNEKRIKENLQDEFTWKVMTMDTLLFMPPGKSHIREKKDIYMQKLQWISHLFQIFEFELTPEEMKEIDAINSNLRYSKFLYAVNHPNYPFSDEY